MNNKFRLNSTNGVVGVYPHIFPPSTTHMLSLIAHHSYDGISPSTLDTSKCIQLQ